MRAAQQIAQCVRMHARKADEHDRVVLVVLLDVVRVRLGIEQLIALLERNAHGQRIRFRRSVRRDACEHLPADLQCRGAVGRAFLDVGQRQPDLADSVPSQRLRPATGGASSLSGDGGPHSVATEYSGSRIALPMSDTPPPRLDAATSDPVTMRWMVGSPPPPDKLIQYADSSFTRFPRTRWSYSHMRELLPTVAVQRRDAPVTALPRAERDDLDAVRFTPIGGKSTMTWGSRCSPTTPTASLSFTTAASSTNGTSAC